MKVCNVCLYGSVGNLDGKSGWPTFHFHPCLSELGELHTKMGFECQRKELEDAAVC